MRIEKLVLNNFRCFEKYELELAERFTLLIGDNGSGKTAILDGLAVAVGAFLLEVGLADKRLIAPDDMRNDFQVLGQIPTKEKNITKVNAVGFVNNENIDWAIHKENVKGKNITKHANSIIEQVIELIKAKNNPNILFPVIAYYGTGRLWNKLYDKPETLPPESRLVGYQDCLNPASNQKRFFRWFKTQELVSLQKGEPRHVLEVVREAIISMIPDTKKVWWDMGWDELRIEILVQGKLQPMPFRLLSDGYRNIIGMVADIAYRMATLNPQLEKDAIKQTEGIVLIDEIDLHLHPKWQRIVVERLLNTFPKVQFVASTHSPFIIQSLYQKKDCLLWDLEKNKPLEIASKSIEDIAEDQQGVEITQQSRRFLEMEKAAEEYYRVLKQIPPASEAEKQPLKQRLDELLFPYSDDPAYQAFLKMERLAIEGNNEA